MVLVRHRLVRARRRLGSTHHLERALVSGLNSRSQPVRSRPPDRNRTLGRKTRVPPPRHGGAREEPAGGVAGGGGRPCEREGAVHPGSSQMAHRQSSYHIKMDVGSGMLMEMSTLIWYFLMAQ